MIYEKTEAAPARDDKQTVGDLLGRGTQSLQPRAQRRADGVPNAGAAVALAALAVPIVADLSTAAVRARRVVFGSLVCHIGRVPARMLFNTLQSDYLSYYATFI
jgi:hypothetical protein